MMNMGRSTLMVMVMALMMNCMAMGAVYKVGDSAGWTTNVDYKSWSSSKKFHVGDVIVFEYKKGSHNVVRVNHKSFDACNAGAPLATYATGNDSITIKANGHYYFICSFSGHCQSGQKVDIRVIPSVTPPPSISTAPAPSPVFDAPAPAPQKSGANGQLWSLNLWAVMTMLPLVAAFVFGLA